MSHLRIHFGLLALLAIGGLNALTASSALALETKSLTLNLTSPDPGNNINYTTVYVDASGTITDTDSADASISGSVGAKLGVTSFNALTGAIPDLVSGARNIAQVEFHGGSFSLSDVSMSLGDFWASANVTSSNVGGTVDTPPSGPGNPAATTGYSNGEATFNAQDHEMVLNQGAFTAVAKLVGIPVYTYDIDLSSEPMAATTEGTGTFTVSLASLVNHVATYDVVMDLPLAIDETFEIDESGITETVDITAESTIRATAQFTRTLPTLAGDLNTDGFVGGDDLDMVRSYWGQLVAPGAMIQGDPSGDGFVGGDDLDIIRAQWGMGTPPAPAAVPEPSIWASLVGLTLAGWGCIRRRRCW